jgi:uncharacterized protein YkwD
MKDRVNLAVRGLLLFFLAVAAARADKPAASSKGSDPKPTEKTLPPEARHDLLNLVRRYNAARGSSKESEAVVRRAIEIGELGVKRLGPAVEKDYQETRRMYMETLARELAAAEGDGAPDETAEDPEEGPGDDWLADFLKSREALAKQRQRAIDVEKLMKLLLDAAVDEKAREKRAEFAALSVIRFETATVQHLRDAANLADFDPEEAAAIIETNKQRVDKGLPPLAVDRGLCLAAADHSADMEKLDFFDHESPVEGKTTPADRAKNFGTTAAAENIAQAKSGEKAVEMWMDSDGHRRNILDPYYRRIGVGRSGKTFTQMFGR